MFLYKQGQITNYSKPYVAIGELATRTAPYRSRRDFFFLWLLNSSLLEVNLSYVRGWVIGLFPESELNKSINSGEKQRSSRCRTE